MTQGVPTVLGGGRFEVLSRLGEGGGGVVYEVRDRDSDARLALKTVRVSAPEALVSLKREFRAVQDMAHPNLVRLDELFEDAGSWFFTMELVDGVDFLAYVRKGGPRGSFDESRLRETLAQVTQALAALHGTGMLHRDVKPSNVLVAPDGHAKLLDFGIAARADRAGGSGVVGTLAYMAPEQLLSEDLTPAADFYAMGVMLYEALTGQLPFLPTSGPSAKVTQPATRVRSAASDAPEDLALLCDALLRLDARERPDAAMVLRALGADSKSSSSGRLATAADHFVGREREIRVLNDAFDAAARGETKVYVVQGASGLGKSALVGEFLRGLRGRALVLQGRCHEREYVPYKGLDAIVDELADRLLEWDDDRTFALSQAAGPLLPRLFPALERVPYFERLARESLSVDEGDPHELRARIFSAFRELVTNVARRQPLVLAIDDVQWADRDTLALLSDVVAPPSPPPLLLVCTRRVDEGSEPEALPLPGDVRTISLDALSASEASQLATRLSHETPLEGDLLAEIASESGGHPLFLQELVRGRAQGARPAHLRLDDALWSRVLLLGESERRIVEAVAIAGVPTQLDVIASATAIARRDVTPCMAALRGASLVKLSGTRGRQIEPYHDRVREAVVLRLDGEARRTWHEKLARALERTGERDVERLAIHWEGAGDSARAATLFREGAERAAKALAFDRAVDLYKRTLALAPTQAPDRSVIEHALAEALFNAGRGAEAGRAFLALAGPSSDRSAIDLRQRAATTFLGSGHMSDGLAALRSVIAAVGLSLPNGRLSAVVRLVWNNLRLGLRGLALRERDSGSVDPQAAMRVDACWSAARERTARAIATARALNADRADPYTTAFANGADGFAAYMLEDWATARDRFAAAVASFRDTCLGTAYELGTTRWMLGRTLVQQGELRELEAFAGPVLRDAVRRNDVYNVVNTRASFCVLLALARDDVEGAASELSEIENLLPASDFQLQHVHWLNAAGMVDLYQGKPEAALARLEAQKARLRRSLLEHIQSVRVILVHLRARAHLALARRDPIRRAQHVARARENARRLVADDLPAAIALASLVYAAASAIEGDRDAARAALHAAIARFDAIGMKLHATAARHALGRMLGGEEGRSLADAARAWVNEQNVAAPDRFLTMVAPGLEGESGSVAK